MMQVRLWLLLALSCNSILQTIMKYQKAVSSEAAFLVKITVVKYISTRYNIFNLRCAITLTSFEPTFTLNGIPILPSGCQALTPQGGLEGKAKGWLRLPT